MSIVAVRACARELSPGWQFPFYKINVKYTDYAFSVTTATNSMAGALKRQLLRYQKYNERLTQFSSFRNYRGNGAAVVPIVIEVD